MRGVHGFDVAVEVGPGLVIVEAGVEELAAAQGGVAVFAEELREGGAEALAGWPDDWAAAGIAVAKAAPAVLVRKLLREVVGGAWLRSSGLLIRCSFG